MRPWLTFPLLFLGLLFLLMPLWITLGDAAVWTWYDVTMTRLERGRQDGRNGRVRGRKGR